MITNKCDEMYTFIVTPALTDEQRVCSQRPGCVVCIDIRNRFAVRKTQLDIHQRLKGVHSDKHTVKFIRYICRACEDSFSRQIRNQCVNTTSHDKYNKASQQLHFFSTYNLYEIIHQITAAFVNPVQMKQSLRGRREQPDLQLTDFESL